LNVSIDGTVIMIARRIEAGFGLATMASEASVWCLFRNAPPTDLDSSP
jgi:hypothetical protein